jgi:single-stranded DNA-specific DHH superfamily exonuclease
VQDILKKEGRFSEAMVPDSVIAKARSMLETAKRPLFLHDNDGDGTASFIICYQFCKPNGEGKGIPVKRGPSVTTEFLRYVEEFNPDLIVILDKPKVDVEFLEQIRVPVLWIDHHGPQLEIVKPFQHVLYLNPRNWDDNDWRPTTYWSYIITKTNLWLATIGSIADWHVPDYITEFQKLYSDLLPEQHSKIEDVYAVGSTGLLVRVLKLSIKGSVVDARKAVLTLAKIESPYEILQQTTARGKFLWRKYQSIAKEYEDMLAQVRTEAEKPNKLIVFIYEGEMAFSSELSDEILSKYPNRVLLIGRKHDGSIKASFRSTNVDIPTKLDIALKGLDGYGGGHKYACGMSLNEKEWDTFYERFVSLVNNDHS